MLGVASERIEAVYHAARFGESRPSDPHMLAVPTAFEPDTEFVRRLVAVAQRDADLMDDLVGGGRSMLSPAETAVLHWLVRAAAPKGARIAELGAYVGGTTRTFCGALKRQAGSGTVEVYDFFQHNPTSRRRLAGHPKFNERDFFDIWRENTAEYADLIELHRGDLCVTAAESAAPLWMVYVDIVKSSTLIDPLMHEFLGRLRIGGFLVHQDYFHWQSPWVVYATERIMPHLQLIGTVSNHMLIAQLSDPIDHSVLASDFIAMSWADKDDLFQQAIDRFNGIRSGLLRVSRLRLRSTERLNLPSTEVNALRTEFANAARVQRYLDAVIRVDGDHDAVGIW